MTKQLTMPRGLILINHRCRYQQREGRSAHTPARLTALDSTLHSSRTSWSRCSSSSASSPLLSEMTRDVNLCSSVPRTQNLPVPWSRA